MKIKSPLGNIYTISINREGQVVFTPYSIGSSTNVSGCSSITESSKEFRQTILDGHWVLIEE
jgi:hypothetical protein